MTSPSRRHRAGTAAVTLPASASPARPAFDAATSPLGAPAAEIRTWFDDLAAAELPDDDGSLDSARAAAEVFGRRAKADNTRRAYRAGVAAWCAFCEIHGLVALPADGADVAAFLAAERRRGLKSSTIELRRAAIRCLHFYAGCPVPTAGARVAATLAGIRRDAADKGELPVKKLAATLAVLTRILAAMPDDLVGIRDRALLLVGFAGALRRSELAAIEFRHLEPDARGLKLTLPRSKGDRNSRGVTVALPHGETALCPVRALEAWLNAAGITDGPVFRRVWTPPTRPGRPAPLPRLGTAAIASFSIARIIQARAAAAGFEPRALGGHSLKRGALTTGMDHGVHPTRLKRLGRHKSYTVLDEYLEQGDAFEGHPLSGLL